MGRAELPTETNSFRRKVASYTSDAGSLQYELGSVSHTSLDSILFISELFPAPLTNWRQFEYFTSRFLNVVQHVGALTLFNCDLCIVIVGQTLRVFCFLVCQTGHTRTAAAILFSKSCHVYKARPLVRLGFLHSFRRSISCASRSLSRTEFYRLKRTKEAPVCFWGHCGPLLPGPRSKICPRPFKGFLLAIKPTSLRL